MKFQFMPFTYSLKPEFKYCLQFESIFSI